MRAFVMERVGEVSFADKPSLDDPGPNGAIVKTTRAMVCTSDTHIPMSVTTATGIM